MAELLDSGITMAAATLIGLALTTVAILRDLGARRLDAHRPQYTPGAST